MTTTNSLTPLPITGKQVKKKELTELQTKFLNALAGEAKGDAREAMKIAGYSSGTQVADVVKSLKQEILTIAEHILAQHSIKAVMGLANVLDNPGKLGSQHAINAAKEILDRVGLVKKGDEPGSNQVKTQNIFILPPKEVKKVVELNSTEFKVIDQLDSDVESS